MNEQTSGFRSLKTLSIIVMVLFGVIILSEIAFAIASLFMIAYPGAILVGDEAEPLHWGMLFIGLIALLLLPVRLLTAILFLVWLNRGYKNLPALGVEYAEFTSGWAVGYWFIPFINLVYPLRVVRELWDVSGPEESVEFGGMRIKGGTPAFIIIWWILFLISNFLGRAADNLIDSRAEQYFPIVMLIAAVCTIPAALLAAKIVRDITRRQDERSGRVLNVAPPAPPSFDQ